MRPEVHADISLVRKLTDAAFSGLEHSSHTEGEILDALRQAGALSLSLVAEKDGAIIGHVAFSPVLIGGEDLGWFGLGPVSVSPMLQRGGIGRTLIVVGLELLKHRGAAGCVVVGDPNYYQRFGFTNNHALRYGHVPAEYFQSLILSGGPAEGDVAYHKSFNAH